MRWVVIYLVLFFWLGEGVSGYPHSSKEWGWKWLSELITCIPGRNASLSLLASQMCRTGKEKNSSTVSGQRIIITLITELKPALMEPGARPCARRLAPVVSLTPPTSPMT